MTLGEYLGAGSGITKGLRHLNGSSVDSSGNGNNGTDTNITYVAGKFGNGAQFAGNNSTSQIALPTTTLNGFTSGTVSMRVKKTEINKQQCLITKTRIGVSDYFQIIAQTNNYRRVLIADKTFTTSKTLWTDTTGYHHIAVTWSGTNVVLYFDGNIELSTASNVAVANTSWNTNLGALNSSFKEYTLAGIIDEVIIENVAWTQEQIKKYYTMSKGRFGIL